VDTVGETSFETPRSCPWRSDGHGLRQAGRVPPNDRL